MKSRSFLFSLIAVLWLGLSISTGSHAEEKPAGPPALPDTVTEHQDLVYATYGEREITLDLYTPKAEGPHPGILLVHGGGWTGGTRQGFRATAILLAERGYAVANIDYRLATEEKFPGAVNDLKAAVRWMRAHAATYGIDPSWIGGIGGSAGGHLVGMVATTGPGKFEGEGGWADQSSALQAAILMGAGVDQVTRVKEAKNQSIKNCVIFFGAEYQDNPEIYAQGSPITWVSKDTPPLLFMDGEFDNPGQRYGLMREKLDALGVRNEFKMIPGAKHGQWAREPWLTPYVEAMDAFFKSVRGE